MSCTPFEAQQNVDSIDPDLIDHVSALHHEQRRDVETRDDLADSQVVGVRRRK